jgi:hypothetical protein
MGGADKTHGKEAGMLRSTNEMIGYRIDGTDDILGEVHDFYFDDRAWRFRYLVVDTGMWLPGRLVLIAPQAIGRPDWMARLLHVELTKQQVEDAPTAQRDLPVSRQHELDLARYYGWTPYWNVPLGTGSPLLSAEQESVEEAEGDPHLRSVREVLGYHILASDGEIGHVEDLIVETGTWVLRYVVVDTRNWLPGRKVLIVPDWTHEVDWKRKLFKVALTRDTIKNCPEYDSNAPVNREYEVRLYDYYGRPKYWE